MSKSKSILFAAIALLPLGKGFAATVIQAETYTAKDAGTILKTSGTIKYMDFASAQNAYVEWNNIIVANAGEYRISLRYASANPTLEGVQVRLIVNNGSTVNASSTELKFLPATGSWTVFADAHFIVRLNSGTNKIRVTQSTTGGPNLDYITLYAARTKVYTGTLDSEGNAIPGAAHGTYGSFGIPETLATDQVRGFRCYLSYSDPVRATAGSCAQDARNSVVHYFDNPMNVWYVIQPDRIGNQYALEVDYWD